MRVTVEFVIVREYSPMLCMWHAGVVGCQDQAVLFRVVEIFSSWTEEKLGYRTPSGYPGVPLFFSTLEEVEQVLLAVLKTADGVQVLQTSGQMEHEMFRKMARFLQEHKVHKD